MVQGVVAATSTAECTNSHVDILNLLTSLLSNTSVVGY